MHGVKRAAAEVVEREVALQRGKHYAVSEAGHADMERHGEPCPGEQPDVKRRHTGTVVDGTQIALERRA